VKSQAAVNKQGKPRFKFVNDIISELKKVTWPTRREATYLTTLVIIFTVAVAIVLGVIDFGFSKLMNVILLR
jgi:preprotein translocase subunit SecE